MPGEWVIGPDRGSERATAREMIERGIAAKLADFGVPDRRPGRRDNRYYPQCELIAFAALAHGTGLIVATKTPYRQVAIRVALAPAMASS